MHDELLRKGHSDRSIDWTIDWKSSLVHSSTEAKYFRYSVYIINKFYQAISWEKKTIC